MNKIRVDDVMTHFVVTLRPEDTIEDAARMLGQNGIRGAPVVQERKLVGLVSEADLLRAFAPAGARFDRCWNQSAGISSARGSPEVGSQRSRERCHVRGCRFDIAGSLGVGGGLPSRSTRVQPASSHRWGGLSHRHPHSFRSGQGDGSDGSGSDHFRDGSNRTAGLGELL